VTFILIFLSPLGERLGEGDQKAVRNPLTQPLPLAAERRIKEEEHETAR
jgi:hypothetical protein